MNQIERRTPPDRAKAIIINVGIIMGDVNGRTAAALFLKRYGAHFNTIVRLPDNNGQRRPTSASNTPTL
jgi:hypothetical protein